MDISDIVSGFIGSVLGAVALLAISYSFRRFRASANGSFWAFPGGKVVIVRSAAFKQKDPDNPNQLVRASDLFSTMAVEALWKFLSRHNLAQDIQIKGSNKMLDGDVLAENIIFVGGTLGNPICKEECARLQRSLAKPIPYYWHGQDLDMYGERVLKDAKQALSFPTQKDNDNNCVDYGLVMKVRNQHNRDRWMYVLAGNLGVGTYMSAVYVVTQNSLKRIQEATKRQKEFCFVVKGVADEFQLIEEPERQTPVRPM